MIQSQSKLDRRKSIRTGGRTTILPNVYSLAANEFALILVLAFSFLFFQLS